MSDNIEPTGEAYKLNPDFHKMSDFLGVNIYDRNDYELAKKMSHIHDWAMADGKGKTMTDCLLKVRELQRSLGHQFVGKPLITEMYKYIRLMQDKEKQDMELKNSRIIENQKSPIQADNQQKIVKNPPREAKNTDFGITDIVKQKPIQQAIAKQQEIIKKQITNSIQDTMKQSARDIINKTITDKNFINNALKGAFA